MLAISGACVSHSSRLSRMPYIRIILSHPHPLQQNITVRMHLHAAPAYSIGRSKRSVSSRRLGQPGPATYNTQIRSHSPSWKMSSARRNSYSTLYTPGPGTYLVESEFAQKSKGISFKGRPQSALSSYKTTPGPSDYQPHYSTVLKNQPSHKIPRSGRQSEKSLKRFAKMPGPATYNTLTNQNWKSGTRFACEEKQFYTSNPNPGPCSYHYAEEEIKLKKSVPKFSFGSSQRIKDFRPASPGPGDYEIPGQLESSRRRKKGFKIPVSKKGQLIIGKRIGPGPATYDLTNPPNLKASPAYTISGGPMYEKGNYFSTPGPASYNTPSVYSKLGIVIGKAKREMSPSIHIPGPTDYNYQAPFGSGGPKYTIHSKHHEESRGASPGPGDYHPKFNDEHIASPIIKPQGSRMSGSGFESPGPGFYNSPGLSSKGFTMGRQKRDTGRTQRSPGPGQYDVQSSIGNLPQYALHSSTRSKEKQFL